MPAANGASLRLEMRTQKQLKGSAELRETLDILVPLTGCKSTREFLTYSGGGKRFRVSFALRWALARLLAGRRGASSGCSSSTSPTTLLDAAEVWIGLGGGAEGGRRRLRARPRRGVAVNPLLAEAFEQVVSVESDGAVSRIAE